ncbi:MAG: C_GCAxxG_C_C family protein [Treponema sp.]|nr:C_GCAxxG_C_C family protein [Treponema sp.]
MTIQERAETAANLKATGACNCCQAVTKVFSDTVDVSEEDLKNLSSLFMAGMGCMEATCGALIGANIIAGLQAKGKGSPKIARELLSKFKEKCGATICKELKGSETGKVLCECPDCVRNAVLSLGEVLGEK